MRLIRLLPIFVCIAAIAASAQQQSRWAQPADALANQIAAILGPGQVHLSVRNLSTISPDQLPVIQRLVEEDLKAHGIVTSGEDSASSLRVTFSENARERLWVAEVVEGKEVHLAMVHLDREAPQPATSAAGLTLRKQLVRSFATPIVSALELPNSLITLAPDEIAIYAHAEQDWQQVRRVSIGQRRPLSRDPRGLLVPTTSGTGFNAWLPGVSCSGDYSITPGTAAWDVRCRDSDDPWPILLNNAGAVSSLRAFYNAGRNYFTGVVTPNLAVDLPPFYSAALVPRAVGGTAMLINGIDGKVRLVDNNALTTMAGTRDWGSDFAALNSGCNSGTQIVASGSGAAASDSLRAYELPALEALPASPPLTMNGTVTALSPAADGKSLLVIVLTSTNQYEVDRVTATCN
jgi:hypothetical protein